MANWNLLETGTTFDFYSVASDGTDLYFVQYGGGVNYQVFKYTVATDTVSQLSNDASWGVAAALTAMAGGGLTISCLQWFKSNLYVAVYETGSPNTVHVYRYNGSGTAWTNVLTTTKHSYVGLVCTADHLLLIQSGHIDFIMDWAMYSSDGSSWSSATIDNSPAYYSGNAQLWSSVMLQGTDKIVLIDKSDNAADYNYRWFEWDGAGNFNITQYTENIGGGGWSPADAWLRNPGAYFGDRLHWYVDGTTYKYANNLGDAWTTPGNNNPGGDGQITPTVSINFTEQLGTGGAGAAYLLVGGTWIGGDPIQFGNGLSHAAKMSSGFAYGMNAVARIFGRDEAYPAPETSRKLYIYRTSDHGASWTARKVET